ncbi:FAD-binding oxidoreductase [Alisedimentitalea sp. MJ-SS2]|uniref:NAD(P)/FAD-dependent oxidoreductase n=1 Tax=Aliisedimentitalea sp. MJ-SS2 TaxID=3049795 RepID=UPI00290CA5A4|nr:FAD-binding oxidoreductase [Alisedimentitalea sp. MJ-SS2]MDU8927728.1 FAD-binding oxidoreductase [Alisedimentitalea sp. MJ-SS2]
MVDVTIRGAGVFGLSIAWECLSRGASVRVVDPNGVGKGASGGVVGALAPHVPENWNDKKKFQFDSLIAAEEFWKSVVEAGGDSPGYARLGRLQPVADERGLELARRRAETAAELWQGKARWQVIRAEEAGEWAPASPTGWLIRDDLTARMHPRSAGQALARAIAAKGGEIVEEAADAGAVIWAAGVWDLERISGALGKMVGNGVKGQGAVLDLDARGLPQIYANAVHVVPHENGTVAIGSTSERDYEDPTSVDGQLDEVLECAFEAVPVLRRVRVIERWAGLRPRAKSRAPMLGAHPICEGQFIANGGFKIGFGMGPGVARVMTDLVLEGHDGIPEGFRVEASL